MSVLARISFYHPSKSSERIRQWPCSLGPYQYLESSHWKDPSSCFHVSAGSKTKTQEQVLGLSSSPVPLCQSRSLLGLHMMTIFYLMLKDQFSENLLPLVMNCWTQQSSNSNLSYGRNEKKSRENQSI